jgi:hypothetical protein
MMFIFHRVAVLRWAYLVLALLTLLPLAGAGWRSPQVDYKVYLPLVTRYPCMGSGSVIFGCVFHNGAPAADVPVRLDFLDSGPPRQTIATTITDAQGRYKFENVPTALFPDGYEVRFENTVNPAWVWMWYTPFTYTAGTQYAVPLMDITNLSPGDPPDGAHVTLPYTFTWGVRQSPLEYYHLLITNSTGSVVFYDGSQHHAGSYSLNGLSSGLQYGVEYRWYVWIDGGTTPLVSAYSLSDRRVTFAPATSDAAAEALLGRLLPSALSRWPVGP